MLISSDAWTHLARCIGLILGHLVLACTVYRPTTWCACYIEYINFYILYIHGIRSILIYYSDITVPCLVLVSKGLVIECFHMTSRRPYLCPKTMKRRPCWCPKPILWEMNSFLMQMISFVPKHLHRCWPREWKHSIQKQVRNNAVKKKQRLGVILTPFSSSKCLLVNCQKSFSGWWLAFMKYAKVT